MWLSSVPQLDDSLADTQHGSGLHRHGCGEALRTEEGAVGGAEVLDVPAALALEYAGVSAGGEVVVEDEGALGLRPMSVPDSRRRRLVPVRGPSVTVSELGTPPRRCRLGGAGCLGRGGWAGRRSSRAAEGCG